MYIYRIHIYIYMIISCTHEYEHVNLIPCAGCACCALAVWIEHGGRGAIPSGTCRWTCPAGIGVKEMVMFPENGGLVGGIPTPLKNMKVSWDD